MVNKQYITFSFIPRLMFKQTVPVSFPPPLSKRTYWNAMDWSEDGTEYVVQMLLYIDNYALRLGKSFLRKWKIELRRVDARLILKMTSNNVAMRSKFS